MSRYLRMITESLEQAGEAHRTIKGLQRQLQPGGEMAEPKLEIEQRMDKVEERLDNIELAVGTMAQWLVQAQTGFGAHDAAGIEKILRGEKLKEPKE